MKTLTNIIKLTRLPLLILVVAIQLVTHYCIVEPMITHADGEVQMGTLPLTLCVIATVFIALGGFWVNDYMIKNDLPKVDKSNPGIQKIYEWVQSEYDGGRVTMISDEEMINQIHKYFVYCIQDTKMV